jgi:hypothetical protein
MDDISLIPRVTLKVFDKWVVDFVGQINPPARRTEARYIITAMEYLTRRAEVSPLKDCSALLILASGHKVWIP